MIDQKRLLGIRYFKISNYVVGYGMIDAYWVFNKKDYKDAVTQMFNEVDMFLCEYADFRSSWTDRREEN